MSAILDFYRGIGTDARGRTLADYAGFTNEELELCHNHIQWQFPLPEPSRMQPGSPVLTDEDIEAFKGDPALLNKVRDSLLQFQSFLRDTTAWWAKRDHNHLRITRVLRFLTLVDLEEEAYSFHGMCVSTHPDLSGETREYWDEALKGEPALLKP